MERGGRRGGLLLPPPVPCKSLAWPIAVSLFWVSYPETEQERNRSRERAAQASERRKRKVRREHTRATRSKRYSSLRHNLPYLDTPCSVHQHTTRQASPGLPPSPPRLGRALHFVSLPFISRLPPHSTAAPRARGPLLYPASSSGLASKDDSNRRQARENPERQHRPSPTVAEHERRLTPPRLLP